MFYPTIPFVAFSSGKDAIEEITSNPPLAGAQHCVILLDIYMPEMNGFAFADAFAQLDNSVRSRYTIVMLSSSIDAGDMENVKKREVIAKFISKPLNESILRTVLEDAVYLISSKED